MQCIFTYYKSGVFMNKLFEADTNTVNRVFDSFIKQNNINFNFSYDWKDYPEILDYLKKLMYTSYFKNKDIRNNLNLIIHDVEEFFACGINNKIFDNNNLISIINDLSDNENGFQSINYLPKEYSGCFGASIGNEVFINKKFSKHPCSPMLDSNGLRRLYIFHEMGHKIINILSRKDIIDNYTNTIDNYLNKFGIYDKETNYKDFIYSGFWMIEECLVQELAEVLTYNSLGIKRPDYTVRNDLNCNIVTNHDYYGIFQVPTVQLGRTLRGCGHDKGYNDVLLNMIKKALNSNFNMELISEYNDAGPEAYYDLFLILRLMGIVRNNKYASFGLGKAVNANIPYILEIIKSKCNYYKDFRDYPLFGFNPVDFSIYSDESSNTK